MKLKMHSRNLDNPDMQPIVDILWVFLLLL